jgi:hypothetical protein
MKQIVALQHLDEEAFDVSNCKICKEKYNIKYYKIPPVHSIPVGDLDYSKTNIKLPLVDNYPDFLSNLLYRKIEIIYSYPTIDKLNYFIKPADYAKRFCAHVITMETIKKYKDKLFGKMYLVENIEFFKNSEVRYYITNDIIVFEEENEKYSYKELLQNILYENKLNYYGTIDMATTKFGPTLVECDYNLATGWYGDENNIHIYLDWLVNGFKQYEI